MKLGGLPYADRLARGLPYLATVAIVIGVVNFFWFMAESMSQGDANQGKIVDGHYFLGDKGRFTEVDRAAWEWSEFHGTSVFVTHALAMAGGAFLLLRRSFPAQMAGSVAGGSEQAEQCLELVRGSGLLVAKESMGGSVGPVRMTAPLLEVAVYPKGVIVRPRFTSEYAILGAEILDIAERRGLFQPKVEIAHLGLGSQSPLQLYRHIDDPIVLAIRAMVARERATMPAARSPVARLEGSTGVPGVLANPVIDEPAAPTGWARWSLAGQPAIPGIEPPWLGTVLEILGLCVGAALLASGLLWAIPRLGLFGTIWTAGVTAILLWNGSRFVRRHLIAPTSERPGGTPRT